MRQPMATRRRRMSYLEEIGAQITHNDPLRERQFSPTWCTDKLHTTVTNHSRAAALVTVVDVIPNAPTSLSLIHLISQLLPHPRPPPPRPCIATHNIPLTYRTNTHPLRFDPALLAYPSLTTNVSITTHHCLISKLYVCFFWWSMRFPSYFLIHVLQENQNNSNLRSNTSIYF